MPKCFLKHTAYRLLNNLLLISLLVGYMATKSQREGTVRNLTRQGIRGEHVTSLREYSRACNLVRIHYDRMHDSAAKYFLWRK
jgi:hypothetical protein